MRVLFDTNILARAAQPGHPMHQLAVSAGEIIRRRGDEPCLVPQVLYEFWVVCTRPRSENGLQFPIAQVASEFMQFEPPFFSFLDDTARVFSEWKRLVMLHHVHGKDAHDARLAAAMIVHRVESILPFNVKDFGRFREIKVLDPIEFVTST